MRKVLFSLKAACFVLLGAMVFSGVSSANVSAETQIRINKQNFPDAVFRKHVKKYDKNANGSLSKAEIRAAKEMVIENGDAASYSKYSNAPTLNMKGMEYFTNVQKIRILWYHLKNFDTSQMKNLKVLSITECYQKTLELQNNQKLKELFLCGNNCEKIKFASPSELSLLSLFYEKKLKKPDFASLKNLKTLQTDGMLYQSLDLRKCKKIKEVKCFDGSLKKISLGKTNTKLKTLRIYHCKLTSIDVKKLKNLKELSVEGNQLKTLNVTKNRALERLYCEENKISTLDVSKNSSLKELHCQKNLLQSIDTTKNRQLESLICDNNKISRLDVSQNSKLATLSCDENAVSVLDVSKNTMLKFLYCDKNNLKQLDLSQNGALSYLDCSENHLTTLELNQNGKLVRLRCDGNNISSLDVSQNGKLEELYCSKNNISTLDTSKNNKLQSLDCSENAISTLDFDANAKLAWLRCSKNPLKNLDVSMLSQLSYLDCKNCELTILHIPSNKGLTVESTGNTLK